jgi:hypothetical protein
MTWLLSLELLAIYEAGTNGDRVRSVVEGGGEEGVRDKRQTENEVHRRHQLNNCSKHSTCMRVYLMQKLPCSFAPAESS